jgi:thiosulfate dehydrogenase (quinone) large subunit
MRLPPPLPPALALLPLRLFLGGTFVYAGVQKLSDPGFLEPGAPTYIGTQLEGFARGTPGGWVLDTFALPHPGPAGVGVALVEILIGLLVLAGRFTRVASAGGFALSVLLFLTASWRTKPYFLGPDIVFAFAWLPFVLGGAMGQPALDTVRARTTEPGSDGMTRRAAVGLGLGALGAAFVGMLASMAKGRYVPPARAAGGGARRLAASSALHRGQGVVVPGAAPGGEPALVVRQADGRLAAVGAICPHAGCEVLYRDGDVVCPCHDSRFDLRTGAVQQGPAQSPLPVVRVRERDGGIFRA